MYYLIPEWQGSDEIAAAERTYMAYPLTEDEYSPIGKLHCEAFAQKIALRV